MKNLLRTMLTWLVCIVIGPIVGVIFLVFWARGMIWIEGYWKTFWAILRGRLLIVSNHPVMQDPLVYVGLWWWACILYPPKFLIWNLPGRNYFDDLLGKVSRDKWKHFPKWIYPIIHCIPVDRGGENLMEVIRKSNQVISAKRTLLVFGETRRTGSRDRNDPGAEIEFTYSKDGSRQIQPCTAAVIKTSTKKKARFITAWISVPFWKENPDFGFKTWWKGRHLVTVTFSDSYVPDPKLKSPQLLKQTQQRVLET